MEEGFEKTRHFLQLLTDSCYLTGEDAHLEGGESDGRVLNTSVFGECIYTVGYCDTINEIAFITLNYECIHF